MKTRHLVVSFVLGLGLALGLMWALAGRGAPSVAAPPVAPTLNTSGAAGESTVAGPIVAPSAPLAELYVCATCTYTTVQAAVDVAGTGDVIKVAAGTYTGVQVRGGVTQVVYISKTVIIRGGYTTTNWTTSEPEANPTILDAQGQGRVFYITGNATPTVEGLRITGGNADGMGGGSGGWDAGGGLCVMGTAATINNNWVFSNAAYGGGGVYLHRSPATLSHNTISSNTISDNGGGVYLFESEATLSANIVISNFASDSGGGVYLDASDATLSANMIISNTANGEGGGLYIGAGSKPWLSGNTIISNTAGSEGGGLYLWDSSPTLSANTIFGNSAVLGGGLFMRESSARLDANIVADNQAANSGSGLYVAGSSLRSQHTTIARNADGDGSGIYVTSHNSSYSAAVLTNTILVSQTVGIMVTVGNTVTLEATLWGDGDWANAVDWAGTGTVFTGTVNVYGDPAFVSAGDYHLTEDSAARDEGVDTVVGPDVDLDLRPIGAGFDIGADEYPVVVTTTQDISITLVYTDPQDNPTEVEVPPGAVTETVMIIYTPKHPQAGPALPEGKVPGAHVFDLDVYRNGVLVPHYAFEKAITLTSEYAQTDVQGMDEGTLALYRWTEDGWQEIGEREGETQTLDVDNNVLTVYLLSNSRFREYGVGTINYYIFLPSVIKDG